MVCALLTLRVRTTRREGVCTFLESYADWMEDHLDEWTTTNDGVLLPGVKRHYVRIQPPAPGEPFYNPSFGEGRYNIANRAPGEQFKLRGQRDHRRQAFWNWCATACAVRTTR